MTRVYVVVEGPTEESFIKDVLAPVLWSNHVYLIPIILGAPGHRGGNVNYAPCKKGCGRSFETGLDCVLHNLAGPLRVGARFSGEASTARHF